MTYNYNAALYSEKDSELGKQNTDNINEMQTAGRCNNCVYFKFGNRKCTKTNESGKLVRPDFAPITYTEPTNKGNFIHILKPSDCKNFTPKNKKKSAESEREAT